MIPLHQSLAKDYGKQQQHIAYVAYGDCSHEDVSILTHPHLLFHKKLNGPFYLILLVNSLKAEPSSREGENSSRTFTFIPVDMAHKSFAVFNTQTLPAKPHTSTCSISNAINNFIITLADRSFCIMEYSSFSTLSPLYSKVNPPLDSLRAISKDCQIAAPTECCTQWRGHCPPSSTKEL